MYIYTHLQPLFILRIAFEQSLCFLIASHKQTQNTNRINGALTKTTYMLHIAPTYICDIYVTYM